LEVQIKPSAQSELSSTLTWMFSVPQRSPSPSREQPEITLNWSRTETVEARAK
jgi:hypothetical protein